MKQVAYLCPGQGAQHVGMGVDLCAEFEPARRTFEEADDALGLGLSAICRDGPEEALTLTENTQPALLTMSVAIARVLEAEAGVTPVIAAGHSLGEWSAWVLVGALEFGPAVGAARMRGQFMQDAVAPGVGAMSAVLGTDLPSVEEMCRDASSGEEVVVPANLNGGGQIVVAGHMPAVARLEEAAAARKNRVSRLKVSAPFHSPLMAPAAERLGPVLDDLTIVSPRAPVVTNVEATPLSDPARIAPLLRQQVTAVVRWEECGQKIATSAEIGIEVGPGRVLGGLMRRIERSFACRPTGDVAGVRKVLEELSA
ncbi:MAG: ACP S-malonyltransferase [Candidatus Binatia bacterium]|nr:ACP S-malonyltransferase [Candidatus Binatia bacterium]